jgi:chromosome partitioning protein
MANIKGGVGKTTAVVNLAYLLTTEFKFKVLVIDSDDQGNATKALGVREKFNRDNQTLWNALEKKLSYRDCMIQSDFPGLFVLPATKQLRNAQLIFGQSARGMKLFRHLLADVERDFDFVLIDTKPQINILLQAALASSSWYLIPSFPESDSYDGFADLVAECEEIRMYEKESLNCLGLLFTCVKKSAAHTAYLEFIVNLLSEASVPVFPTHVRASNTVASGGIKNLPASALSGAKNVKEDYTSIANFIVSEMKSNMQGRPRKRPDLQKLGILEEKMAPGHMLSFDHSEGDNTSIFS